MVSIRKKLLKIIFFFCCSLVFSPTEKTDSLRGSFTYLLTYKPSKVNKNIISQENFSLQISDDSAFFISENRLKFDSIFKAQFKMNKSNIDMKSFSTNKPMSRFTIIQTNQDFKFYESVDGTITLTTDKEEEEFDQ